MYVDELLKILSLVMPNNYYSFSQHDKNRYFICVMYIEITSRHGFTRKAISSHWNLPVVMNINWYLQVGKAFYHIWTKFTLYLEQKIKRKRAM